MIKIYNTILAFKLLFSWFSYKDGRIIYINALFIQKFSLISSFQIILHASSFIIHLEFLFILLNVDCLA